MIVWCCCSLIDFQFCSHHRVCKSLRRLLRTVLLNWDCDNKASTCESAIPALIEAKRDSPLRLFPSAFFIWVVLGWILLIISRLSLCFKITRANVPCILETKREIVRKISEYYAESYKYKYISSFNCWFFQRMDFNINVG